MKQYCLALLTMLTWVSHAQQDIEDNSPWTSNRPDGHAPISIMGDHVHSKGEWMIGYQYMFMNMDENYLGEKAVTDAEVLSSYMSVPDKMQMHMHMLHIMYAPSDKLTLMVMGHYLSNEMQSGMGMHGESKMHTDGFSDLTLSALYPFFNRNHTALHGQIGVIIPTGSIDETGTMHTMHGSHPMHMGYAMQLGSGSFGTKLALTYLWQNMLFSAGAQAGSIIPLHDNDKDYRLGNQYALNAWFAVKTTDFLSFSLRGNIRHIGETSGADERMMPEMSPATDAQNSGGVFAGYGVGANFYIPSGSLKNLRFGLELALPLYRDVNGIQMVDEYSLSLGTHYSF